MAQHFLLSAKARTLSLAKVMRMSETEAYAMFRALRWAEGEPVCTHCGHAGAYEYQSRRIFKCKACRRQFSVTSGTVFSHYKLPMRDYLAAVAIFVNAVKGVSALQLSRDLGVQYRTAFVLAHKLREALASEQDGVTLAGDIEVDGAYFGGYVRPENRKEDRKDRRYAINKNGKRKSVVVMRERGGRAVTAVFPTEHASTDFIMDNVKAGSVVYTDEAPGWDKVRDFFQAYSINHQLAYSDGHICTNQAESYFSRLRRSEIGTHHFISGRYLDRYAGEMAWRENHRRDDNGSQFVAAGILAMKPRASAFKGYSQRHLQAA
ncbi:MAG: IS1595 family transposase [Alphaproteobacteria bacterium HGW-Alphaproteobacteria-3]|nr:MAG: IS1595 family transposase [Alphaproteobacteria bacterium HGW-Alphaproteobacteria-3]